MLLLQQMGVLFEFFYYEIALIFLFSYRIGFAIAHRLAKDGAKVVVSSRKASNVKKAVEILRNEKLECHGMICHVGKSDDRKKLIDEVHFKTNFINFL